MEEKERQVKNKHLKKWNKIPSIQTREEFQNFINQSLENREGINRKVKIGEITEDAKLRIDKIYGKSMSSIGIDNNGIIHAHQRKHNLEHDDLLYAVDIINTTSDISLSNSKHQDCDVLVFKKDIDGNIKILTEVHKSKDYLMIFDAMRKNKAQRRPDATKMFPGANVQDAPLLAFLDNIPQNTTNVNGKKLKSK
ncbi:hypothetical protein [Treponema sp. R80B11-R83G3]